MFRFSREKILPLFLQRQMTVEKLAQGAGIHSRTAARAVNGLPITSRVIDKICSVLKIEPIKFLVPPTA